MSEIKLPDDVPLTAEQIQQQYQQKCYQLGHAEFTARLVENDIEKIFNELEDLNAQAGELRQMQAEAAKAPTQEADAQPEGAVV